jgi:hypothetical protein
METRLPEEVKRGALLDSLRDSDGVMRRCKRGDRHRRHSENGVLTIAPTLYQLRQRALWGDYGEVLVSGFFHRSGPDGRLRLTRTGTFLPPISFPYCSPDRAIVVTSALRRDLETQAFPGLAFREAFLDCVVPIAWETWNRQSDFPQRRPPGGEPESYLRRKKHSQETADRMEAAWEMICPTQLCAYSSWLTPDCDATELRNPTLILPGRPQRPIFVPAPQHYPVVNDTVARWFEATVPDWVELAPLKVQYEPEIMNRLQAARERNAAEAPHLTSQQYRLRLRSLCEAKGYAVPPAMNRDSLPISRYCVVRHDATPPKVSALTYATHAAVGDYLEHRLRTGSSPADAFSTSAVYDLETGARLRYQGNGGFICEETAHNAG